MSFEDALARASLQLGPKTKRGLERRSVRRWAICLWLRQSGRCQYCQKQMLLSEVTVDHVVPVVLHGTSQLENLVAACYECNLKKGCSVI